MSTVVRFAVLVFFQMWAGTVLFAQTPAYLHYRVQDGLPGNLVYCCIQDDKKLLWFGTDKGLACFDGTHFRSFGMKDGLPDPDVFNLMSDSRGRLWISNFKKKPCYRQNGRFVTGQQDSLLAEMSDPNVLWEFYEDTDGSIWLGGQSTTFYRYEEQKIEKKRMTNPTVMPFRVGNELFYAGVGTIMRPGPDTVAHTVFDLNYPLKISFNPFVGVCFSGNRILYAFVDMLLLLEYRNGKFVRVASRPGPVGRVFSDRSGRFWVCSLAGGAYCFENNRRDLSNPVLYLPGQKVTSVFEDAQGTHWFCTAGNGIFALPRNVAVGFDQTNGLISNNIHAVALDRDGNVMAGDDEANLYVFNKDGSIRIDNFGSLDGYNRCRQIIRSPGGDDIWIISDEAIIHQRGNQQRQIRINASPKYATLLHDTLWYTSSGSIGIIDPKTFERHHWVSRRFTAIASDSDGNIWAGGIEGVYSRSDSFLFNWGERFPLLKSRIIAMQQAGVGRMWIVTADYGLLSVQTRNGAIGTVEMINDRLKSPIDNIQSIFYQPGAYLWLATNKGVFGITDNWSVIHFDRHDGLADDDVNAVMAYGDTLWAATVGGLSRVILKSPDATGSFPTLITNARYRLGDQIIEFHLLDSIPAAGKLVLPPDATLFELGFSGLDYRSRGNLRYECRTETSLLPVVWWTLDNLFDWVANGFKAGVNITQVDNGSLSYGVTLPPGCYQISITAVTTANLRSRQPDYLFVVMRPHWYNTLWFGLLVWGGLTYIVWRIVRARIAYRRLDAAVSELQLQALQAQMNPHFIGNSINAIQQFFYPPDPVLASEYISLFTRLLRRTLLYSEQTFITFEDELAYDNDYLSMVKLRFGDRFRFEVTGTASIPPSTGFPSMLLQPLLENATLHGLAPEGDSILHLDFGLNGKYLVCTITDNGAGLKEVRERQKAGGIDRVSKGLELLLQKVQTLNRRYDLGLQLELHDLSDDKIPGRGTRVTVRFYPDKIPNKT